MRSTALWGLGGIAALVVGWAGCGRDEKKGEDTDADTAREVEVDPGEDVEVDPDDSDVAIETRAETDPFHPHVCRAYRRNRS